MNTRAKGVLLVVGAYFATMAISVFIIAISLIIILMGSYSCNATSQAMLVLWGIIAVVFLASVAVVGIVAWKMIESVAGRLAIVAAYGVLLLTSYVVIAFGLMVVFNC